jgi:uncharacterized metal-binding protein YceD (DUF177 family)
VSSEFSRLVDIRFIDAAPLRLEADAGERAALAKRFGIVAIERLTAVVALEPGKKGVTATGTLDAEIVQSCAVSAEDVPVTLHEAVNLRFVPERAPARHDDEVELDAVDLDEIEFTGNRFDLGEAVAQTLALAIDPFLEGPGAEEFRRRSGFFGEERENPFAALSKLKKD